MPPLSADEIRAALRAMEQKKGDQRRIAEDFFGMRPGTYANMMLGVEPIHGNVLDKLGLERVKSTDDKRFTTGYKFKEKG